MGDEYYTIEIKGGGSRFTVTMARKYINTPRKIFVIYAKMSQSAKDLFDEHGIRYIEKFNARIEKEKEKEFD